MNICQSTEIHNFKNIGSIENNSTYESRESLNFINFITPNDGVVYYNSTEVNFDYLQPGKDSIVSEKLKWMKNSVRMSMSPC